MDSNDTVIAAYERWLRSWASPPTTRARVLIARSRLKAWGSVENITPDRIQEWLGGPELKSGWSRSTYHAHMTDFCKWLVATHRLADNPMTYVRKGKRPRSQPRPLSEADVARVLAVAEGRQRDWLLLALLAGLRAHEIAKIRGEDVTSDGIYVEGKGGTKATIPLHPDLAKVAARYPHTGYWFLNRNGNHITSATVTNYTSILFRSLGITGSIHRCRHVYGTRLLRSGTNIRTVQKLMRHSNLDTTAAYTAVDEDELRAAINLLSA